MANFYRVIFSVFFAFLFSLPLYAADYLATTAYSGITSSGAVGAYDTVSEACAIATGSWFNTTDEICPGEQKNYVISPNSKCGGGGTLTGTLPNRMCAGAPECTPPETRNEFGVCSTNPCVALAGTTFSSGYFDIGTDPNTRMKHLGCDNGCETSFNGSGPDSRRLVDGVYRYFYKGSFTYTAVQCSAGSSPPVGPLPPETCPTGQTMGQVNGQNVCVKSDGNPGDPNGPQTTPTPPPPDTTTKSPTVTNPDGTTTQTTITTTTTNNITTTDTTTTNTGTDGTQTVSTTSTSSPTPDAPPKDPMDDFCVKNPTVEVCRKKKDGEFGGTCGAFTCTGDPIQCAIAREQHTRNCTLFTTETSLSTLGNELGSGTDSGVSANPANLENRTIINLPTALDKSKVFGSACMADLSVQVMSSSITIPFSNLCPYMEMMGKIVVAFSMLSAARIVSGGVA